ncbi:MAG: hypothetical protein ACD_73C00396G0003 [uncultured bacterium]|nr:MAG: hypothetical protein ACD_73C00396G0003 [uncultured bacterium]
MKTLVTSAVLKAAGFIKKGQVVAFPTETVFGLGANAFEAQSVARIFKAKGRPADNPLIVHICDLSQLNLVVKKISPQAQILIDKFFPGPLTLILPKSDAIAPNVSAGLKTVGVRMPDLKLARDFIKACGVPLAAPSANISGKPSGTTWQDVLKDFKGRIPCVLKGKPSEFGMESTVIDCSLSKPKILRLGAITVEELEVVLGKSLTRKNAVKQNQRIKSPGMKYRHYAPKAIVIPLKNINVIKDRGASAFIGLNKNFKIKSVGFKKICHDNTEYAHHLYHFFRECDARGIKFIYCEWPSAVGLGQTLQDRLLKAAKRL